MPCKKWQWPATPSASSVVTAGQHERYHFTGVRVFSRLFWGNSKLTSGAKRLPVVPASSAPLCVGPSEHLLMKLIPRRFENHYFEPKQPFARTPKTNRAKEDEVPPRATAVAMLKHSFSLWVPLHQTSRFPPKGNSRT